MLCKKYEGVLKDAKWVKEYSFKEAMQKAFDQNILQGDGINFSGLFDAQNFDSNLKAAIKVYEEHVLNVGELDERIFLGKYYKWNECLCRFIHGFLNGSRSVDLEAGVRQRVVPADLFTHLSPPPSQLCVLNS